MYELYNSMLDILKIKVLKEPHPLLLFQYENSVRDARLLSPQSSVSGPTTGFGIVARQEKQLLPGVYLVREVHSESRVGC